MSSNTYTGRRIYGKAVVTINGRPLTPMERGEPFDWGYNGSEPEHLSRSILTAEFGPSFADLYAENFKREVVSALDETRWSLDSSNLEDFKTQMEAVDRHQYLEEDYSYDDYLRGE
jgi:hypothetical protein